MYLNVVHVLPPHPLLLRAHVLTGAHNGTRPAPALLCSGSSGHSTSQRSRAWLGGAQEQPKRRRARRAAGHSCAAVRSSLPNVPAGTAPQTLLPLATNCSAYTRRSAACKTRTWRAAQQAHEGLFSVPSSKSRSLPLSQPSSNPPTPLPLSLPSSKSPSISPLSSPMPGWPKLDGTFRMPPNGPPPADPGRPAAAGGGEGARGAAPAAVKRAARCARRACSAASKAPPLPAGAGEDLRGQGGGRGRKDRLNYIGCSRGLRQLCRACAARVC